MRSRLWSVILAGGEGQRLEPFVRRWQGRPRPKQYCTFVGSRSLFQHTVDRADRLADPSRRITVVAESHREEVRAQLGGRAAGTVIHQPANRGTAAGLFVAAAHVRARQPGATVVVFPSDHFVHPEDRFVATVRRACRRAERIADRLVLLGAPPRGVEPEYGWIVPGRRLGRRGGSGVWTVKSFVEKPSAEKADAALAAGGLWNTLVLASRVETLWEAGRECVPDLMPVLEDLAGAIGGPAEPKALDRAYAGLGVRDFSFEVLQRAPDRVAVCALDDVWWSDWGRPERILHTLRHLGMTAAFPTALATAARSDRQSTQGVRSDRPRDATTPPAAACSR